MEELDLGEVAPLPEGEPALRVAADGRRFVCVRRGERVDVLDDRCPHEGYPLSQGQVRDGVLTCCWHNWKFELDSGACSFGGESVRRYRASVEGGRLRIDPAIDADAERARIERSLREKMRDATMGSVMRDALRLAALDDGSLRAPLACIASDAARRAPWGFEHGLAMLADVASWIAEGTIDGPSAFAAVSTLVAEPLLHLPERAVPEPLEGEPRQVLEALRGEHRERAEAITRGLVCAGRADELLRDGLLPFLGGGLSDYGHGAIFVLKARELAARFPEHAADLWASAVLMLSWVTMESALPGWRATARAIQAVAEGPIGGAALSDPDAYREAVLGSEKSAASACAARVSEGVSPRALLLASARAAAERVARFDDAWERRLDSPITFLDVSHALTFAEAALALADDTPVGAQLAVQSAAFVGKLRAGDRPEAAGAASAPLSSGGRSLERALRERDLALALASVEDPDFQRVFAPFALHEAFVRPLLAAHAVKMAEACRRLEALDPEGEATYRAAVLTITVPRRPERGYARLAHVAARFLADGRPPPGLY